MACTISSVRCNAATGFDKYGANIHRTSAAYAFKFSERRKVPLVRILFVEMGMLLLRDSDSAKKVEPKGAISVCVMLYARSCNDIRIRKRTGAKGPIASNSRTRTILTTLK